MYACSLYEYVSVDAGEGVESPGDGISDDCKMSQVGAENQTGPMVQKLGLLTTEPSHRLHMISRRNQKNKVSGFRLPLPALELGENLSLRLPKWVGLQPQ